MDHQNEGSILRKREPTPDKEYGKGYDMEAIEAQVELQKSTKRAPPQPYLSVDEVQKKIQYKIEGLSPRASDQQRRIHNLFGRASELNKHTFKRLVERLGFTLTEDQAKGLFRKIDADNSGGITLTEFLRGVIPKDSSGNSWHDKRRDQEAAQRSKRREAADANSFRLAMASSNRTPKQIATLIAERIVQLTAKPTDQMRKIRRIFAAYGKGSGKSKELGPKEMQNQLLKIEIVLSEKEAKRFFEYVDEDGSGTVSMNEFFQKCNPSGWEEQPWYIQAREDQNKALKAKKNLFRNNAADYQRNFRSPAQPELSPRQVKQLISDKVKQLSKKSSDQVRKVSRIFKKGLTDSKKHDLLEPDFREHVAMLGVSMTDAQSKALFKEFDKDGSGDISLIEFLNGILGEDVTEEAWHIKSMRDQQKVAHAKRQIVKQGSQYYQAGPVDNLTVEGCINLVREKITAYSSRQSDQTRQILRLFGFGGECGETEFHEKLQKLGITLHDKQLKAIFQKFDLNGNGKISIQEFMRSIFPDEIEQSSFLSARQDLEESQKLSTARRKRKLSRKQFRQRAVQKVQRPVKSLKRLIHDRIVQRSKRPSDQLRKVRNIFASHGDGKVSFGQKEEMTIEVLQEQIAVLGVMMNQAETEALFNDIDTDRSGGVSMHEFLRAILPEEFSRKPWWEKSREKDAKMIAARRRKAEKRRKDNSSFIGGLTFSKNAPISDIVDQIRMRVDCRTSKSSDTVRQLMRRFQKAGVVDPEQKPQIQMGRADFGKQLKLLGVNLTKQQVDDIFTKFDEDKSNTIDLTEFISNIHQDYTGESYFEKRPMSGSTRPKRMLGATNLRRGSAITGSGVVVTNPNPPSPLLEREKRRAAYLKKKQMQTDLRRQREASARAAASRNATPQASVAGEEIPETFQDDGEYGNDTKLFSTPKIMSPRRRDLLQKLLIKSLGGPSVDGNPRTEPVKRGGRVYRQLRGVETESDRIRKRRKRSRKGKQKGDLILRRSPRNWTGVLRSSQKVWTDASSKPQYYSSKFSVGNAYKKRNANTPFVPSPPPPRGGRPPRSGKYSRNVQRSPRPSNGKADAIVLAKAVSPRVAVTTTNKDKILPEIIPSGQWVSSIC